MTREEEIQNAIEWIEGLRDGWNDKDNVKYCNMAIKALEQKEPEKCEDCISRQAAIDAFERFIHELGIEDEPYNYGEMALSVQNVPSVEPERKPGKWISEQRWCLPQCSECGASCFGVHGFDAIKTRFCPTCGAKMEVNDAAN